MWQVLCFYYVFTTFTTVGYGMYTIQPCTEKPTWCVCTHIFCRWYLGRQHCRKGIYWQIICGSTMIIMALINQNIPFHCADAFNVMSLSYKLIEFAGILCVPFPYWSLALWHSDLTDKFNHSSNVSREHRTCESFGTIHFIYEAIQVRCSHFCSSTKNSKIWI